MASLPEAAVRKLATDPSVRYIQRILEPGEKRPASGSVTGAAAEKSFAATAIAPTGIVNWTIGEGTGLFVYDDSGNIMRIGNEAFAYDTSGRLVNAKVVNGVASYEESYAYDGFGNLTCKKPGPPAETCPTGSVIAVNKSTNRLTSTTYDVAGRVTQNGSVAMTWQPDGMMRDLNAGTQKDFYVYDASGERVGKTNKDVWHWTIRDLSGRVAREYESSYYANYAWLWIEDRIYRDGQPLAVEREAAEGGVWHLHTDHLGSVRMVTNQTGQQISRHVYAPFGRELTLINQAVARGYDEQSQRFTGHERDFNGGTMVENQNQLDYMHARYYSPVMGRFLSVDPAMDIKKNLSEPQMWNRYSYVGNNPLGYLDPGGKLRVRAVDTGSVFSNRPFVYKVTFENRTGLISRGGGAVAKRFLGPLKQLPGIIDKGTDLLVGREAKTDSNNLKGVDAVAGLWDTAKFEGKIQDAFKDLGAQSLAGSGYYDDKALQTLQKAVDSVLNQMVEAGEIMSEQAKKVRAEYDLQRLRNEAERMSVDTNPTDDPRR